MNDLFKIRLITENDASGALEIYEPYVLHTAVTFEYETPTLEDFSDRIRTITAEYPWLVCLKNDKIIGYAYAVKHRQRKAYQWSPESSVYLNSDFHRKGIARILYETLFAILRIQGYINVYAGLNLPNEKSEKFHRALGFEEIGDFKKIGYKLGAWHDVRWFQLHLIEHPDNPPPPKPIIEIQNANNFGKIIEHGNILLKNI